MLCIIYQLKSVITFLSIHIFVDFFIDIFVEQRCSLFSLVISDHFLRRAIFPKRGPAHFILGGMGGGGLMYFTMKYIRVEPPP